MVSPRTQQVSQSVESIVAALQVPSVAEVGDATEPESPPRVPVVAECEESPASRRFREFAMKFPEAPWQAPEGSASPRDAVSKPEEPVVSRPEEPVVSRPEEPVWKAEDFPSLNAEEAYPSLTRANRTGTPRRSDRSSSRGRHRCESGGMGSISESRPQMPGSIPEGKPECFRSRRNSGGPAQDRMHQPRGPGVGLLNKSNSLGAQQFQPLLKSQQPPLQSAWQQRQTRTAKSVEPEPRQTLLKSQWSQSLPRQPSTQEEQTQQKPRVSKSVEPEPRQHFSTETRQLPKTEEAPQESTQPNRKTSENRCQSEPVTPAISQDAFQAAAAQASKIAKVHHDLRVTMHGLLEIAEKVKNAGCLNTVLLQHFQGEHATMMKLTQELQADGTSSKDTAALVALNLLIVSAQLRAPAMPGMTTPVAGPKPIGLQQATSSHSTSFVPVFVPQASVPGGATTWVPNMWVPQGVARAPNVNEYRAPSAPPRQKSRTTRKYNVINPSTGEKMVIRSCVAFRWRPAKRLPIVNPKTGLEILPEQLVHGEEVSRCPLGRPLGVPVAPAARESIASSRLSCSSRLSTGTTGSAPRRSVTPSAGRRERRSIAGRMFNDGQTWVLEPAAGGSWDWPLSRQEKKDRVLMLSQLELLDEITELQTAACCEQELE